MIIKSSYKLYGLVERVLGKHVHYMDLEVRPKHFCRAIKVGPILLVPGYDEAVRIYEGGL